MLTEPWSPPRPPFHLSATSRNAKVASTPAIGRILTASQIVKKVSFRGSTNVGKLLMQPSSSIIKKLALELGGNAPFIVFDDCVDIDAAASCIAAKFRSSGQTCVCANRIYVQSGLYDTFAKRLTEAVPQFKLGFGFDSDTTHGPLASISVSTRQRAMCLMPYPRVPW